MRKGILCIFALGLCAACTESGLRAAQQGTNRQAQRIAGTGDLAQPRFAGGSGSFLAVTDGGQPNMVFVVNAVTLEVEPVSFRLPPPGVPATTTSIGEIVRDLLVTPNDDSSSGSVTGTKNLAVFLSQASNLLDPGTGLLFHRDSTQCFLKDIVTGENFLVSADPDGVPANSDVTSAVISASGRFVAFATRATNLYVPVNPSQAPNGASQIYVLDLATGSLQLITANDDGEPGTGDSEDPVITPDGRFVAFRSLASFTEDDTNTTSDVYLYDRTKRMMDRISDDVRLDAAEPALSENGMFVAFTASEGGPRQVFVRTRSVTPPPETKSVSGAGDDDCHSPSITPDGELVAFASAATNLLGPDEDTEGFSDVFVVLTGTMSVKRASVDVANIAKGGNGNSAQPTLSPDGRFIAYISEATNVALDDPDRPDGDTNGLADLIITSMEDLTLTP